MNKLFLPNMKYAILDLDGTILDSMEAWKNVTRDYLASLGITAAPDIREHVKRQTARETAVYLQQEYGVQKSKDEIIDGIHNVIKQKYEFSISLKPAGAQILHNLKERKIPFCAATSTDRPMVEAALKRLNIYNDFSFILTCSEVGKGKYYPDIFYQSMELLGGQIENTVVFEDALHCVQTAKNAGFTVIGVYEEVDRQDWNQICALCDDIII